MNKNGRDQMKRPQINTVITSASARFYRIAAKLIARWRSTCSIRLMIAPRRFSCVVPLYLFLLGLVPCGAAAQSVDVGGLAFVDYFYTISSPASAEEQEGFHGFTYRRLYLTADFRLSDEFHGRARLEANEEFSGPRGPVPFVKDLYLTWDYAGDHSATLGVAPPPAFEISEDVWGYRSLEKTILDLEGIVSSRDFGIRFDGMITPGGGLRYSAMLANNEGTRMEDDTYKRAYAQLAAFPTDELVFTIGADRAGYDDTRDFGTRVSGLAGYRSDAFRFGVEGFWAEVSFDATDITQTSTGLSLFGAVRLAPEWEIMARVDRSQDEIPGSEALTTFLVGGLAYQPNEFVRLIPNFWFYKIDEAEEGRALGRFTVDVRF